MIQTGETTQPTAVIDDPARFLLLYRDGRASVLKSWGLELAKRIGMRRAKVAVARKLAVIMHRIWSDQSEYRWTAIPSTTA